NRRNASCCCGYGNSNRAHSRQCRDCPHDRSRPRYGDAEAMVEKVAMTSMSAATTREGQVPIRSESDIVLARREVREVAGQIGFSVTDTTRIVTAASELARNIFKYAGQGVMQWRRIEREASSGLELQFIDNGPGIADINLAMQEGFSTSKGLGM